MLKDVQADFIVAASVVDVRRSPDADAERVTQALMNVPVMTGDIVGEWVHVRLADYAGWVREEQLEQPIVHGFCEGEGTCGVPLPYSVVVTDPYTALYAHEADEEQIAEIYLSTVLPYIDLAHAERFRVALPGDGEGWLERSAVDVRRNADLYPQQEIGVVISYAKSFLGRPYLWGGTSWCGIDCSGFVQLCYRMGGNILPRDADQQHDFLQQEVQKEEMEAGDLIFFGQKSITHVGLAINRHEYIHAEGSRFNRVMMNSFDMKHPDYDAHLAERVWGIKRVRS